MALTRTSTSAAVTASQVKGLGITSTSSGFPGVGVLGTRQVIQIDSEKMLLDQVVVSGVIDVLMRGYDGSAVVAHDILAPVVTSSDPQDFPAVASGEVVHRPPDVNAEVTLGQDGALALPLRNTNVLITKASACLFTLAAPSKAQDGIRLTITSATAQAHVLTATSLLENGLSGSPFTTATFAAFIGGTLSLIAMNGVWNLTGAGNGVTLS